MNQEQLFDDRWRCGALVSWKPAEMGALGDQAARASMEAPTEAAKAGALLGSLGCGAATCAAIAFGAPALFSGMVFLAASSLCAYGGALWGMQAQEACRRWIDESSRFELEKASIAWQSSMQEQEGLSESEAIKTMTSLAYLAHNMAIDSLAKQGAPKMRHAPELDAAKLAAWRLQDGPAPQPQAPARPIQWLAGRCLRSFLARQIGAHSVARALSSDESATLLNSLPGVRAACERLDLGQSCAAPARAKPRRSL